MGDKKQKREDVEKSLNGKEGKVNQLTRISFLRLISSD